MNELKRSYITEFIGVDLLRFLLSIVVVFRHYYHFYFPYSDGPFKELASLITEQPFFNVLWPFYDWGNYAVQVFWLISGLIFYSVYHQEIIDKEVSFKKFCFLRFSRLYPLHFLTLLVAAAAQGAYFITHGAYFVYQSNDLSHFFLQLFFMGNWMPEMEHSFNVPVWSVSIEIFVYLIFYLVTLAGLIQGKRLIWLICVCLVFNFYGILLPFNGCLLYFFCGCLLAKYIQEGVSFNYLLVISLVISVAMAVFVQIFRPFLSEEAKLLHGFFLFTIRIIPIASFVVLLFIVVFRKISSPRITTFFKNLGNMTYSVYMVHFPLQIIIFLAIAPSSYVFFNSPWVLFLFLIISMTVGWIAFEYFEKPVQNFLRRRYLTKKKASVQKTGVEG